MSGGEERCAACSASLAPSKAPVSGACAVCGGPLDRTALSNFASRLARFGLGSSPKPLLNRAVELPDA